MNTEPDYMELDAPGLAVVETSQESTGFILGMPFIGVDLASGPDVTGIAYRDKDGAIHTQEES